MAITLRSSRSVPLTHAELDGNFTDLNTRTTTLEANYVKTVNGVSASSNALTIGTTNITEGTNLYYTDTRSRASISITDAGGDGSLAYNSTTGVITFTGPSSAEVRAHLSVTDAGGDGSMAYNSSTGVFTYTGPSASEVRAHITAGEGIDIASGVVSGEDASSSNKGIASFSTDHFSVTSGAVTLLADGIDDTLIDFGTGTNQVNTADIPELTNLYYTDARADARIAAASIDDLSDVNTTAIAPVNSYVLTWDASVSNWIPAAAAGAVSGNDNTVANLGSGSQIFSNKVGIDIRLRSLVGGSGITLTQNTNDISIAADAAPTFTNIIANSLTTDGIKIEDNNITSTRTNDNLVLLPSGTGVVEVRSGISSTGTITASIVSATSLAVSTSAATTHNRISQTNSGGDAYNSDISAITTNRGWIYGAFDTAAGFSNGGWCIYDATAATYRLVIDSSGNVGIGTTAPTEKLSVDGNVTISGSITVGGQLSFNDNNITSNITNANIVLDPSGTGIVEVRSQISATSNRITNVADPVSAQDAATKAWVELQVSADNTVTDGVTSVTFATGDTTTFAATAGETTVAVSGSSGSPTITIGLPDDITVGGALIVTGNLTVNGTTTTLNTSEMKVEDLNITLADGAADSAAANGAGITIDGAGASITYAHTGTKFVFNKPIDSGSNTITSSGGFAGNATTATTATTVTLVATNTTDSGHFVTFVDSATGDENVRTDTGLTYNPNSGLLTSTLVVVDTLSTDGLSVNDNNISSTRSNDNINLIPAGTGKVVVHGNVVATGSNDLYLGNVSEQEATFIVKPAASGVNYGTISGAATGANQVVVFGVDGSDTNVSLGLSTKGTGNVFIGSGASVGSNPSRKLQVNPDSASKAAIGIQASGTTATEKALIDFIASNGTGLTVMGQGASTAEEFRFDTVTGYEFATGSASHASGTIRMSIDNTGTVTATTFDGEATSAQYADLAEMYVPDAAYPAGTVVTVGGGAEITYCTPTNIPAGVISTAPAYLMNSKLENGVPVALVGRVPVRVVGAVTKGQVVKADLNGLASATADGERVGIALESSGNTGEKLIECMLKV